MLAAEMLRPTAEIAEVGYEVGDYKSFDDVAAKYAQPRIHAHGIAAVHDQRVLRPGPPRLLQDFERLCPEVNRRSLQWDLKAKVDMGLLVSEGSTNKLVYRMRQAS